MMRCGVVRNAPTSGIAGILFSFSGSSDRRFSGRVSRWATVVACVATTFFWTGCIQSGSSGSNSGPLAVSANNGSMQSAVVSTAFGAPLVAVATKGGKPNSGVSVTFTAPATGASGTFANGTATETDTTDSNGLATSSKFTANSATGSYTVTATASGAQGSAAFSLTNEAVPNILINAQTGSMQTATVGQAFATSLSAVVTDNGAPLGSAQVTFTVQPSAAGAGGTFPNATTTDTETTNDKGVATASTLTADAIAGPFSVSATTSGASTPAQFSLTNVAAPTISVNPQDGSQQTAVLKQAFAKPFSAVVTENGNPLGAVTVTFTAPSTGPSGTFSGGTLSDAEMTDGNGLAISKAFTANDVAGNYAVTASSPGAGNTAQFSLTNAYAIVATSGTPQTTPAGHQFLNPLVVIVEDALGNPISGVTVTFTAPPSSMPSGTFASNGTGTETQMTLGNGQATSSIFSANSSTGSYQVQATVVDGYAPAFFNLTNN